MMSDLLLQVLIVVAFEIARRQATAGRAVQLRRFRAAGISPLPKRVKDDSVSFRSMKL